MVISSQLRREFVAWYNNPTARNRARLTASMARLDREMSHRGMRDVFHEDAGMSCPRELRAMLELLKRSEDRGFAAA